MLAQKDQILASFLQFLNKSGLLGVTPDHFWSNFRQTVDSADPDKKTAYLGALLRITYIIGKCKLMQVRNSETSAYN